ncbi:hypothetical protein PGB90_002633 [Kerria lacca]
MKMKIWTIPSKLFDIIEENNNLVTKSVEYSTSAATGTSIGNIVNDGHCETEIHIGIEATFIVEAEPPILQESNNLNPTEFECLVNKNDPAT